MSERDIYSSRVALIEVTKAVERHDAHADTTALFGRIGVGGPRRGGRAGRGPDGGPSLRALDAIHVASALRLAPELEAFVTYDSRQAAAAEAAGLRVRGAREA